MKMNLPNKLTMLRVLMIPVFIVLFILAENYKVTYMLHDPNSYTFNFYRFFAALVFVLASITDYFDGKIARKYNLITNFGKLMDPLADKMLVITALIMLTHAGEINYICTLIVVLREIAISSIRLVALEKGEVIAASIWGKYKTATQMIAIVLILFDVCALGFWPCFIAEGLFYISTILVVISLIDYAWKARKLFVS